MSPSSPGPTDNRRKAAKLDYKEGRGDYYLAAGLREKGLAGPARELFHTGWLGMHAEQHDDDICRCACYEFLRRLPNDAYDAALAAILSDEAP